MNGSQGAIFFYLRSEFRVSPDRWFSVREVAGVVDLSINRTRRYLTLLVLSGCLDTKIVGFHNEYRYCGGRDEVI